MATGDIHNHNGTVCRAEKGRCPFGDEGHSKDLDSYVEHHVQESGVDGDQVRAMIADGTPPADAVEVAKAGQSSVGTAAQKTPDSLQQSPEGIERFQAYRKQWESAWAETYMRHYNQTPEEHLNDQQREALAARRTPGTYDGAWIAPQDDGGMAVPAGDYVFVSSDGWYDYGSEDHDDSGAGKWEAQALEGTPPGAVGGAYLEGKPAFFLTAMGMGRNHGYDGEILVPRATYEKLQGEGYFEEGGEDVHVKRDTVIYGYMGNPKDAPVGLYDWDENGEVSPEADAVYAMESKPEGSVLNHPFIDHRITV